MSFAYISSLIILVILSKDFYDEIYNFHFLFYFNLIFMIFMLYNYNICYFSDPGIIPKNLTGKGQPIELLKEEIKDKNENKILKIEDKDKSTSSASLNQSKIKYKIK